MYSDILYVLCSSYAYYHIVWVKHYALLNHPTQNLLSMSEESTEVHRHISYAYYHIAWVKHYALSKHPTQNLLYMSEESTQVHILVLEVIMNRCGTSSNMHEVFDVS